MGPPCWEEVGRGLRGLPYIERHIRARPLSRASRRRASGPKRPVNRSLLIPSRPMDTVTLTIDARQITVERDKTVLQAAIEHGIRVPYYCYHPGISIDGSCRVCIVKIEKMPKLQTSCSTVCTDGMVVSTRTQEVVE